MPINTHTHKQPSPLTVISNCSAPSHWPRVQSQNPSSQVAIINLSILHESWNLFSILHFVCSSDKELWRSTKEVTKIKQLVKRRSGLEKNQTMCLLCSPYHSAYLECLSHTDTNSYYSLVSLCLKNLISYHLTWTATYAPPFCF